MKYIPKLKKLKKQQKRKNLKTITKTNSFTSLHISKTFIFKALEPCVLTFIQLQAFYKACKKVLKRSGKIILKIFTHIPITKKPLEVRMGKGKGSISCWIAKIKAGTTICEVKSNTILTVEKVFFYSKIKLPLKIRLCYL